jgi:uncharacterized protein
MFRRLVPREEKFFVLFNDLSDLIVRGAKEFRDMISDPAHIGSHSKNIKEVEVLADEVTHRTVSLLHQTFITPIDRGDIHQLITSLDDILDFIEAASQRMHLYGIHTIMPHTTELADIIVRSTEHISKSVKLLEKLENQKEIIEHCVSVNHLENEADQVLRTAMVELFRDESDVKQIIMWKEIYEFLESVTDRCEDVSNIVESIVLEYA